MTNKLLPCPMCGGRPTMMDIDEGSGVSDTQIFCESCFLGVQRNDDAKAIAAWNLRTPDIVRCGECKFAIPYSYLETDENLGEKVCGRYLKMFYPDDFCSYGERRANAL